MNIQIDKIPVEFLLECANKLPKDLSVIKMYGNEIRFKYDKYIVLFRHDENGWNVCMNTKQSVPDIPEPFHTNMYASSNECHCHTKKKKQDWCYDIVVPCVVC